MRAAAKNKLESSTLGQVAHDAALMLGEFECSNVRRRAVPFSARKRENRASFLRRLAVVALTRARSSSLSITVTTVVEPIPDERHWRAPGCRQPGLSPYENETDRTGRARCRPSPYDVGANPQRSRAAEPQRIAIQYGSTPYTRLRWRAARAGRRRGLFDIQKVCLPYFRRYNRNRQLPPAGFPA